MSGTGTLTSGRGLGRSIARWTRRSLRTSLRPTSPAGSGWIRALGKETFADWAARWVPTIAGLTPKTRESYESILRRHLLPRFADTSVNRIDHPMVIGLMAEMTATGAGAGTVQNVRDVLRLVLELARRSGAIKVNPVKEAKAPKKPPVEIIFLDASQIMTLADEVTNPPIGTGGGEHRRRSYPERGLLVRFAGFTGLRSAEIVALRTESVDLLRGRVQVVSSATEAYGKLQFGPPKTYQRRAVPLRRSLVDELTKHLAGKERDTFVFTASRGGPLRHSNFYARHFKPAVLQPVSLRRRGSTICGTATPPCSSLKAPTHEPSWSGWATARSRSPSGPTGTCSPPSKLLSPMLSTRSTGPPSQLARRTSGSSKGKNYGRTVRWRYPRDGEVTESLRAHAEALAGYLNDAVLDYDKFLR